MPRLVPSAHALVTGMTGSGKTYFLLWEMVRRLMTRQPFVLIDNKGDAYWDLLHFLATTSDGQRLWPQVRENIILVNPMTKSDYLTATNVIAPIEPFEFAAPDPIALLANSLTAYFKRQSGYDVGDAVRMQNIMTAWIATLSEGGQGKATLDLLPLLNVQTYHCETVNGKPARKPDMINPYTAELLKNVKHSGTLSFWQEQWRYWTPDAKREWPQPVLGRVNTQLFDERFRLTTCAVENGTLDFRKAIAAGKTILIVLPWHLMTDLITTTLGNLFLTKTMYACMQRPPGSRPYRVIVEEAGFNGGGPLDVILETARAFNLSLTMSVQSLDQLDRSRDRADHYIQDTALNNCRYYYAFHNTADMTPLADRMFPITGQQVMGYRASGDIERKPTMAEANENQRKFADLPVQQLYFHDQLTGRLEHWQTPRVVMSDLDMRRVNALEDKHLRATGRPIAAIRNEIETRREAARAIIERREQEEPPPVEGERKLSRNKQGSVK